METGARPPELGHVSRVARGLSLDEVLGQLDDSHALVIDLVQRAPDAQLARDSRFRRRLRLDTYGHYSVHARAIREWREQRISAESA
jgi:hypothetical protein